MQPWQKDILEKYCNNDIKMTMSVGRQTGKSVFTQLYKQYKHFMKPTSRFVPYELHHTYGLMIQDYMWWTDNEREILNWMNLNLPNGVDHQEGMVITFDDDKDRMMFLLRWA